MKLLALGGLLAGAIVAIVVTTTSKEPPKAHSGPGAKLSERLAQKPPSPARPDDGQVDAARPSSGERPQLPGIAPSDRWLTDKQRALQAKALEAARVSGTPVSLAEAMKLNPKLEESFERNPHPDLQRPNFEYKLGVFARLKVCINDRVKTRGYLYGMMIFELRDTRLVGSDFEVRQSTLTPEEDKIVIDCLKLAHEGFVFEGEFEGARRYIGVGVSFPLERAHPYRAIEKGDIGVRMLDEEGNLIP